MRRPHIGPGRMLLIKLRRHGRDNAVNVDYYPSYSGAAVSLRDGEAHVARVLASSRSVYYFTDRRVVLHEPTGIRSVDYEEIVALRWTRDFDRHRFRSTKSMALFDGITLVTKHGDEIQLSGLGQAVFPLHGFFSWWTIQPDIEEP